MRNFRDTFETRKRSSNSAFSVCVTEPLTVFFCRYPQLVSAIKQRPSLHGLSKDKGQPIEFRFTKWLMLYLLINLWVRVGKLNEK